jgi:beta-lactamase class A
MRKALYSCLILLFIEVLSTAAHAADPAAAKLQARVQALVAAHANHMRAAVAIVHEPDGSTVTVDADRPCPLASVFKLPIMLELARQLQEGREGLSLDKQLTIQESNKCIGSGRLRHRPDGSHVSLREAVELMETISDNTATDLVFNLIGIDSVNRMMASLGLTHSDIYLTNRPAYLIADGLGSEFHGLSSRQIAERWQAKSSAQRHASAQQVLQQNQNLSLARFQAVEDASAARQTGANYINDAYVAATVDNLASAGDIAQLLVLLDSGKLLDPQWTQYCLGVLSRQKYNSRIPRFLPPGTRTFHKTGTITGIVNDAGIIEIAPGNRVVVVVFVHGVAEGHSAEASQLIGHIARAAYDAWR